MADLILWISEEYVFTPYVYGPDNASFPRDHWLRQFTSLYIFTIISAYITYLSMAGLNYLLIFDKAVLKDSRLLPNQMWLEIKYTCEGIPVVGVYTVIVFMFQIWGYSKLYDDVNEYGWGYIAFSFCLFLFVTDMLIYFIHRGLHIPWIYPYIHKPHHKWIVTTPFASHAFHPMDGFLQGLPYHLFVFMFPFHKKLYLFMFVLVNLWTVSIHDCHYVVPHQLEDYINGAAHHTAHHIYFFCNYGQYFTLWDRVFGTHRVLDDEVDPVKLTKKAA